MRRAFFRTPFGARPARSATAPTAPDSTQLPSAPGSLHERVESPSEGFRHFRDSLAPSVKKSPLSLRQKIFRPPTPLVAILPQGLMVLLEMGKQGFQGVQFGLDDAQAREE